MASRRPWLPPPCLPILVIIPSLFISSPAAVSPPEAPPVPAGNTTDHLALLSFKSLVRDPSASLASWNATLHFCRWRGVTCGRRRQPAPRVVALDLEDLDLGGTLSPILANLTFLRRLHLPGNRLGGSLPAEFGRLRRLQYLNVSSNALAGEIPSNLSRCVDLRIFSIKRNMIGGRIPGSLGSLARLQVLILSINLLAGGFPPSLGNLSSLTSFFSIDNRLGGSIPEELGAIPGLERLSVGGNMLTGGVPPAIYNISSLRLLEFSIGNLTGTLPPDAMLTLPRLRVLSAYSNRFHGRLPPSLSNASMLAYLDLASNNFAGSVPPQLGALEALQWFQLGDNHLELEAGGGDDWSFVSSLANCTQMQVFDISKNNFRGTLPASIANLSAELQAFSISDNEISGVIPSDFGRVFVNLASVGMGRNLLTGNIPGSLGNLGRSLTALDLSVNKLLGQIPSSMGNLTGLTRLWLNDNGLAGSIPASFGKLQTLEMLDLSRNRLTGEIPGEAIGIGSLSIFLDLSRNLLAGSLPAEVRALVNLAAMDVSDNKLSGEIPPSLGDCQLLGVLAMAGNSLGGPIPAALSRLRGLRVLDLSRNQFSGAIPGFLQGLRLQFLNLSFNDLRGEVPRAGLFLNRSAYSVAGNPKLCGGDPNLRLLPPCPADQDPARRQRHRSRKLVAAVVAAVSVGAISLVSLVAYAICRRVRRRTAAAAGSPADGGRFTRVSYADLLRATDGFSRENLIGDGSFGSVYKGVMEEEEGSNPKLVAVKVLKLHRRGAARSFLAECETLRSVRHRNLVKILTACSGIDLHGDEFKALVFEFMANGNLEDWLHGEGRSSMLGFSLRLGIAMDVASALDYLHNDGDAPIIHCDLKPSNILLDDDMVGHVGDFGLSRFIHEEEKKKKKKIEQSEGAASRSSIGIKGSVGYIAPEYGTGSKPSPSGDVYSYGMLVLEMLTGRRPTDELFQGGLNLHRYVEMALALPSGAMSITDPWLLSHGGELAGGSNDSNQDAARMEEKLRECLASLMMVGLQCSKENPEERMKMGEVIKEMHKIKDVFCR